ncbi:MAG: hypothetical protein FD123_3223 [Bacteroidetes bacterium]|nr:MAG: hypothetical protein FD123_3223 [Bacteroidota bacterium]
MKKALLFLLPLVFVITETQAQISFTQTDSLVATPNSNDTIGAFARIFYHQPRNKFYVVYAARQYNSADPAGLLRKFAWVEYDTNLSPTGNSGYLPGFNSAGDFAMLMIDSTYYHLTVFSPGDYLLSKYDDDFILLDTLQLRIDSCDSNIDQLLNYTNGRLIIGAMQETTDCPPINPPQSSMQPHAHIFQYDLNFNQLTAPVVLSPVNFCWGSSMIFDGAYYYHVAHENFTTRDLYSYKFDSNFNYVSQTLLSGDGQWAQGVLWDAPYYYVAYHTGDHNRGNILLGVFDVNWNNVYTQSITTYPLVVNGFNANRPFLLKLGNMLYISYDVESYINAPPPINQKDWQSHVKAYQVSIGTGLAEKISEESVFDIFPNPANDFVNFVQRAGSFSEPRNLAVFDIQGNKVRSLTIRGDRTGLFTGDMAKGIYFYEVTGPQGVIARGRFCKN